MNRDGERAIAKETAALVADAKLNSRARAEFARPICESERNCCRRNYASDAFSLSFSEMGGGRRG